MAGNMFINMGGDIKGESAAVKNKDDIEMLSWSHSFNQPTSPTRTSAGAGTVEKAHHSDFSFTKYMDSSSIPILKSCWTGKQIVKCVVNCYRADGKEDAALKYLEITLEEVVISNVSIGGGQGDIPTENISLNYGKITYNYNPQKKDDGSGTGNKPVSHDLNANKVS